MLISATDKNPMVPNYDGEGILPTNYEHGPVSKSQFGDSPATYDSLQM